MSLSEVEKSRHESAHALFAHAHGMAVAWVSVRPKAETLVTVAFAPEDLPQHYHRAPRNTLVVLGDVIGMILAGGMATDNVVAGKNWTALETWRAAWETTRLSAPGAPTWETISTLARSAAILWLHQNTTQCALEILTRQLCTLGSMYGATWAKLADEAMGWRCIAQTKPTPSMRVSTPGRGHLPRGQEDWRAQGQERSLYGRWTLCA